MRDECFMYYDQDKYLTRNTSFSPRQVLARIMLTLVIAVLQAFVYLRIGNRETGSTSSLSVGHILGSIFYSLQAITLLPFASLSLFIYERQYYSREVRGNNKESRNVRMHVASSGRDEKWTSKAKRRVSLHFSTHALVFSFLKYSPRRPLSCTQAPHISSPPLFLRWP